MEKDKHEKDILKLFKENGIVAPWKTKYLHWDWILAEINQIIHQRDYYKKKYDEMRKVLGG